MNSAKQGTAAVLPHPRVYLPLVRCDALSLPRRRYIEEEVVKHSSD